MASLFCELFASCLPRVCVAAIPYHPLSTPHYQFAGMVWSILDMTPIPIPFSNWEGRGFKSKSYSAGQKCYEELGILSPKHVLVRNAKPRGMVFNCSGCALCCRCSATCRPFGPAVVIMEHILTPLFSKCSNCSKGFQKVHKHLQGFKATAKYNELFYNLIT